MGKITYLINLIKENIKYLDKIELNEDYIKINAALHKARQESSRFNRGMNF